MSDVVHSTVLGRVGLKCGGTDEAKFAGVSADFYTP